MKTVSKKYLKRRRLRARFCLSLGWLHISEEKAIENCDSVDAGAQNVGKVANFGLMLTLSLLLFVEIKKGELYILKKVGLSTFKEIL